MPSFPDTGIPVTKPSAIFFDNVTHELKTPLTTILGYAEVIQENGFNTDKEFFEKGISHIINESERLRRMVIDLLELSQVQNEDTETNFISLDLSKLLQGTCEEMQMKANRYNIEIKSNIDMGMQVIGDSDKLKQVFINAIDNSIKYGFENSLIKVIAENKTGTITITIEDVGQGIPENKLQNIFQPFYRADGLRPKEKGSKGLGLAISKAIIEKHGGSISIESKLNVGTKVIIELLESTIQ